MTGQENVWIEATSISPSFCLWLMVKYDGNKFEETHVLSNFCHSTYQVKSPLREFTKIGKKVFQRHLLLKIKSILRHNKKWLIVVLNRRIQRCLLSFLDFVKVYRGCSQSSLWCLLLTVTVRKITIDTAANRTTDSGWCAPSMWLLVKR